MDHKYSFATMSIEVIQEEVLDDHEISERFKNENWAPEEIPESQLLLKDETVIPPTPVIVEQAEAGKDENQALPHERTTSSEFLQSASSPITKESTMDEYVDYPDVPITSVDSLPPAGQPHPESPKELTGEPNHESSLPPIVSPKRQSSEDSEYVSPKKIKRRGRIIAKTVKRETKFVEVKGLTHEAENARLLEVIPS
jgi:hypothetical protein